MKNYEKIWNKALLFVAGKLEEERKMEYADITYQKVLAEMVRMQAEVECDD